MKKRTFTAILAGISSSYIATTVEHTYSLWWWILFVLLTTLFILFYDNCKDDDNLKLIL